MLKVVTPILRIWGNGLIPNRNKVRTFQIEGGI